MLADNDGPTGSFDWAGSARQRHSQYAPILVDETGARYGGFAPDRSAGSGAAAIGAANSANQEARPEWKASASKSPLGERRLRGAGLQDQGDCREAILKCVLPGRSPREKPTFAANPVRGGSRANDICLAPPSLPNYPPPCRSATG